ncbi:DUF4232 domain-containing protein [Nocardioides sp. QY071]|uniref:DUF4232 domain-containing protein n=1 Tax=Nocardioides sp. QY071 TaxID=3044187 RepID=UPI00249A60E8|nr:DUF4232 domain-containing protein [Nocardioides sp. QY071]WGY02744.1 DUF4232 domain-containing protein [Nocardioides sp. QY071]
MRRVLGSLAFAAVLSVLSACTLEPGAEADPVPGTTRAPVPEPSATTAAPGHEELAPGWDESPDGPTPTPDVELDDAALTALLRTLATAAGPDHCTADRVAVTLEGFDQAAGHRYSRLVVRNSGHEPCVVEGVPGVGARGAWGTTFVNEIGPGASGAPADPVRLAPGEQATSDLEWTGDLAGAESEHVSLLVLQLARGQVPVALPARLAGDAADAPPLDIGPLTTVRLTPFRR